MATQSQLNDVIKQNKYCGVTKCHNDGYTGKGINILVIDGERGHKEYNVERVGDSAPDANIYNVGMSTRTKREEVFTSIDYKGKFYTLEEIIEKLKIKIITRSLGGGTAENTKISHFYNALREKYNLIINQSSGNEHLGASIPHDSAIWVTQVNQGKNDKLIKLPTISDGEQIDFTMFAGFNNGTSFCSPYLAGMEALIIQKYGLDITQEQMYDYLRSHCKDLGDKGRDAKFGWGLPIIDLKNEEWEWDEVITKTKIMVNGKILEVNRILKNGENYIRLRDFEDILGVVDVDYDHSQRLPIIND